MKIAFVPHAKRELLAASKYYDDRVSGLGDKFLDEIAHALKLVKAHPTAWPVKYSNHIRQIKLRRFPYAIIYLADTDAAVVLAVAHLHRRSGYWERRGR